MATKRQAALPTPSAGGAISYSSKRQAKLRVARRVFRLIPVLIFVAMFLLFATQQGIATIPTFLQALLRALLIALSAAVVCVAAYGFYKYLHERSPGL